ncbi:MAG: carboxypeptidase-like regulatory domain-containing protein [Prevotellaceae bacterium]|jgi:hypothetical protein|nr:carboxypeptidase-like regulatory domain-containing protein [Prevotellaceae bacterium]
MYNTLLIVGMMIMKQYVLLIFVFFPFLVSAQTIINGSVVNKEGKPVTATVTVQIKGSNTIGSFTTSDKEGNYNLKYNETADSIVITVSGINIGKHKKTVINRSGRVDFVIDETPLELKEVKITQPKIKRTGDTLDYSVGAYIDQNDRVIGDILKKLPGIDVSESGRISYNGEPINKFYVENADLLQGRYGLAVNNIAAKDVATVQVMENHQPINVLRERVFSDAAAINLKLKESAKGTLAITGMAGLGYEPLLWNAELVAMYFAKVKQNMSAYKGNNSGNDVTGEFRSHYDYERIYLGHSSQLYVQSPSTPPVAQKRYLYNNINAFTVNQLIKIKENRECTINGLYYNDRLEKEGHSIYEQYFPGDSTLSIEEKVSSVNKINNAEIAVRLNVNENNYYLNNAFNFKGNWNNDRGLGNTKSAGIDETLSQYLDKPSFVVDNTLNMIKNVNKNSYNIHFSTGYASTPHTLTVTPAFINPVGEGNLSSITQNVHSKEFASVLRLSYGLRLGNFNLDYNVWGRAEITNMNTSLSGEYSPALPGMSDGNVVFADSMKNNIFYNNYSAGFNQSYSYKTNKFRASVELPLIYRLQTIDDRIPDKYSSDNKLLLNPSASISYDLTPELTVSAKANFNKSFGDMGSVYTGYIMHGYRSLLRNTIEKMFETRSGGTGASVGYRNALHALFINAGINYNRSWRNMLYGYNYDGITSIKTTTDRPTESEKYGLSFSVSKGLNFWSTTFRLSGNYSEGRGEQLIQDEVLNYRSENYGMSSSINMSPFSHCGLTYSISWAQNKNYVTERPERFPAIRRVSQEAKISVFITKMITVNMNVEHQYNSAVIDNNRHTSFADAGIKFRYKKLDLELEYNNIFNSKRYISASYNDISSYYYSYNLRPASVLLRARFKIK